MKHASTPRHAFSLVELSIVLVILGLLTGGILTGQSLIRAAELRSVSTQYSAFSTAVMSFRDKYFALPGDMRNATSFWGAAHATPATCATTAATGTATCNGDGNGMIEVSAGSNEKFRFWQHLANAGLVEGNYTGIEGASGQADYAVANVNAPAGKLGNSLWHTRTISNNVYVSGHTQYFDGVYGNVYQFGAQTLNNDPSTSVLSPEEAWNIDTKIDDGKPATSLLVPRTRATCTNATAAVADSDNFDSIYNLTNTSAACVLVFRKIY